MSDSPRSRSPILWWVIVLLVVGLGVAWSVRRGGDDQPVPAMASDPARAVELNNEGLALLENAFKFDEFMAAADLFQESGKLAADESVSIPNRAIAYVLALSAVDAERLRHPEMFATGLTRADEAVATLLSKSPNAPLGHWLAAKLSEQRIETWLNSGQTDAVRAERTKLIDELETVIRLSNDDTAMFAELYLATRNFDERDATEKELQKRGAAALQRVADAQPDNLWALIELVIVQATSIQESVAGGKPAETSASTALATTLKRLHECSPPFVELIQKLLNFNLPDALSNAEAAVEKQDWPTVLRLVRPIANVLRPEIATKLDMKRATMHPLDVIVTDYPVEWRAKYATQLSASATVRKSPIAVSFAEAAAADQLPALAGIRDAKIVDFDLDGRWDVIVLLNGQVIVFGQPESSKGDSRWTTLCEAVVPSGMSKLLACDLDRDTEETPDDHRFIGQPTKLDAALPTGAAIQAIDADIDLLVFGDDGVLFLRNEYDKESKIRSLKALAQDPAFESLPKVLAIAPTDIDHDGDLDLIVSSGSGLSIWQNNDSREHTKLSDISSRSALPPADLKATVLLPVDWNFDVQTDVIVTGPQVTKPGLLENISHGRLRWREWSEKESSIGKTVSLHLGALLSQPLKWNLLGQDRPTHRGLRLLDFNNDGKRDYLTWDDDRVSVNQFLDIESVNPLNLNSADNVNALATTRFGTVMTCEIADFDADGDEDLFVVTDQRPIWVRNEGGNQNGWIDLSLRADPDRKPQRNSERVNTHGLGSLLELRAAGLPELPGRKSHVRIVDGQSTHFGLGPLKQADVARVVWTNGIPQNVLRPPSGLPIAAQQILKGSCPYIYTWDGEQWTFFTDCLWAAPIGLQLAEGVMAPCREWEYLKIDGDRLRESNGEYRVMLTEELWEAAYFDQVQLLAVDHPADVEFFSNEKVGPPSISEFKLHPVRKRHTPVAARDSRGRDVLPKLARRDDEYLRPFDKIIQQGLTEKHFIELDLGDLSDAKNVTLFLTGWIFPTDTSINVSLSQNPDREAPKPPSIWIPSESGEWREAIPYIGFPGGKTKTIAVDLSQALGLEHAPLPPGEGGRRPGEGRAAERRPDEKQLSINVNSASSPSPQPSPKGRGGRTAGTRLRIVTSMELYWDEMFFTVDEPPLDHTLTPLPLLSADLQFRGFSARLPHPEFGPERYDASHVTTATQWPPMGGKFTRFGDITELLKNSDDRLAILGAGDAVTIRFRADQAPKLPPGWKRDFIIHNVGWDKDADLNTIYGQFVEPLPFRGMRGYPDPTGAEFPDSPIHRVDQRRFQTREQNRRSFWLGH